MLQRRHCQGIGAVVPGCIEHEKEGGRTSDPRVRQVSQVAMGGSFNMRRLVHGRTNAVDGRVRWTAAILGFALPALALLLAAPDPGLLVVLSPPQQLGLLTECW